MRSGSPPRAGETTFDVCRRQRVTPDHPRVRGRDTYCRRLLPVVHRITPACGGDTAKSAISCESCCPSGSPPRAGDRHFRIGHSGAVHVRITPACGGRHVICPFATYGSWRITPACGGDTIVISRRDPRQDHPRVRGTDNSRQQSCPMHVADHPRVRGRDSCFQPSDIAQNLLVRVCHRKIAA